MSDYKPLDLFTLDEWLGRIWDLPRSGWDPLIYPKEKCKPEDRKTIEKQTYRQKDRVKVHCKININREINNFGKAGEYWRGINQNES